MLTGLLKASCNLSVCLGVAHCAGDPGVLSPHRSTFLMVVKALVLCQPCKQCCCVPGTEILLSAEAMLCPLQIFDSQLNHRRLDSRCHQPSEALQDTLLLKGDGDGLWSSEPSFPLVFPMPSPNLSQCSSKRLRSSSMPPAAKCPGSPPSCWLLCMQEVSGVEAVVLVLLHHSTRCYSPAGTGDSHLAVVTTTKILLAL